jgi:glyoxylase-like metal-dependent hydrolase (beta-lactamase superfamily II)
MGGDRNFGYLVGDEGSKEAAIIDPAYAPEKLVKAADGHGLKVKYIICTHSHFDHTNGNERANKLTGARIVLHKEASAMHDISVGDGDELELGSLKLRIIHTPGHTEDCICILAKNKLMTGDTLYVGKIGGTYTDEDAKVQFDSLFNKLLKLDDAIEIYPAHDVGTAPTSTIGNERKTNPFLLRTNIEDFIWLKENWAQYKAEHGIE